MKLGSLFRCLTMLHVESDGALTVSTVDVTKTLRHCKQKAFFMFHKYDIFIVFETLNFAMGIVHRSCLLLKLLILQSRWFAR